jgi:hypothetical protein
MQILPGRDFRRKYYFMLKFNIACVNSTPLLFVLYGGSSRWQKMVGHARSYRIKPLPNFRHCSYRFAKKDSICLHLYYLCLVTETRRFDGCTLWRWLFVVHATFWAAKVLAGLPSVNTGINPLCGTLLSSLNIFHFFQRRMKEFYLHK